MKKFALFILYTITLCCITYPLFVLAISWNDLNSYKGICPGMPTDIPEYQCTYSEYVVRILFGGWAILVHMIVFPLWMIGSAVAVFLVRYLWKLLKK